MKILPACLAWWVVAFGCALAIDQAKGARSLSEGEMWGLFGGANNQCCMLDSDCPGTAHVCDDGDDPHDYINCVKDRQVVMGAGNTNTCRTYHYNKTCTEPGTYHTCKTAYDCEWDDVKKLCLPDLDSKQDYTAPKDCEDDCT